MSNGYAGRKRGFTLIELLVVMAILGVLLSLIAPKYIHQVDHAKESVLQQQLAGMREAIDRFYGVHQRYPANLQELVDKRFIRSVPVDPLTERNDSWVVVQNGQSDAGVFDVHSGATGAGNDGKPYASW